MRLLLTPEVEASIRAHAREEYPHECCGALLGTEDGETRIIQQIIRLANERTDQRERRFYISPQQVLQAERQARAAGLLLLGFYHSHPDRYYYADQYHNPANWQAHYETTGVEIWQQTEGRITHFVAGLGTTGTFVGVGRRLREYKPDIQLISLQPDSPFHGLEGLKHLETAIVPGIYDPTLADANLAVRTEDAYAMARRLAREEGLLVGVSAAAAVVGSLRVAEAIVRDAETRGEEPRAVIVTILCDSADKYLSERFWDDETP